MMRVTLAIHILAGTLGLVSGFVALYTAKGARLHRRAGVVFVWAMLVMCTAGFTLAVGRRVAPVLNVPAALLTAAFVVTALTTVRPATAVARRLDRAATLVVLAVGVACLGFGLLAVRNGGTWQRMPAFPFFMFGTAGTLAFAGDVRVMRLGPPRGATRVARHLWRMTFALLIAALSFFIGQAKVFPKPIRIYPLLAMPVLAVLVTLLYWLWRVRIRRSLRGLVGAVAPEAA